MFINIKLCFFYVFYQHGLEIQVKDSLMFFVLVRWFVMNFLMKINVFGFFSEGSGFIPYLTPLPTPPLHSDPLVWRGHDSAHASSTVCFMRRARVWWIVPTYQTYLLYCVQCTSQYRIADKRWGSCQVSHWGLCQYVIIKALPACMYIIHRTLTWDSQCLS